MATLSAEYIKEVHLNFSKLLHLIKPIVLGSLPKYALLKILVSQTMGMPSQQTFLIQSTNKSAAKFLVKQISSRLCEHKHQNN